MKYQENRLDIISTIPDREYTDIWDTCCDHGKLGSKLFRQFPNAKIHFNDIVPGIITKLEHRLRKAPKELYTLNAMDARLIKVENSTTLICICGIGGKMAVEIIEELVKSNSHHFELLICTHYHQIELRKSLIKLHFKLIRSQLIVHQKQHYEVMYISRERGKTISPLSEELYDKNCPKSTDYFKKSMKHFEKNSKYSDFSKKIFESYAELISE
ncbi:tRNA (adenine(22)-N(1))-methyltransferase TrmK [Halobacteriovorax sp. JY17]|uniref:tRNA (adenine(22)-N(1))-methyltransferase TrmK n=1 Tax=Halobacteriovorax sp. JY17 TaxID=2014617 RepID=UPI000C69A963|nr:tRNA (adenine(22)-N(1))-methyltransferase TrmK [Halobacteriovorax sp. JY17]PIK15800.1 MAG: hypothetical protein CES88_03470 [Halobacteriovorax sp. JY17]